MHQNLNPLLAVLVIVGAFALFMLTPYRLVRAPAVAESGTPDHRTPIGVEELRFRSNTDTYRDVYVRTDGGVRLWHYTSNDALIEILRGKTLRATDIRFLNDSAEYEYAVAVLGERVTARATPGVTEPSGAVAMLKSIRRPSRFLRPFVFCLSEAADDLTQWRGYSPPGTGVSLGFETRRLRMFASRAGFELVQCIYDTNAQLAAVDALLEAALQDYREQLAKGVNPGVASAAAAQSASDAFHNLAPALKHPTFAAEKEWRLVKSIGISEQARPGGEIKVRTGKSNIVPFIELPISAADDDAVALRKPPQDDLALIRQLFWPLTIILCGPTPQPDLAVDALRHALRQHVGWNPGWSTNPIVNGSPVGASKIPFRPWV